MSQQSTSSRRELLFRMLPRVRFAWAAPHDSPGDGCCHCPQKPKSVSSERSTPRRTDMTWEELFKFAYGYAHPDDEEPVRSRSARRSFSKC